MNKKASHTTVASALAALILCFTGAESIATERSPYSVEIDAQPFQVRDYPARLEALVQVSGSREQAVNAGFRLLAKYIFGGNRSRAKIAMTAPVLQTPEPAAASRKPGAAAELPSADATVTAGAAGTGWEVAFIMPAGYALGTLPAAEDARIRFRAVPPQRLAAVAFSGFWTDANFRAHAQDLQRFLAQRRLHARSAPIYAFYDPPWTPWFWRTNEVHIVVDPAPGTP